MKTESTLIFAIVTFLLAILAGVLRHKWICIEYKAETRPPIWGNKSFQIVSWIVVASLSVCSAFAFTILLESFLPALIAAFLFGVILTIRWLISGLIGVSLGEKQIATPEKEGTPQSNTVTWESLFKDIEQDDPEKAKEFWQIVTSFLIPDNISPAKFRGNRVTLLFPAGLTSYRTNNPTPSLAKFLYLAGGASPFDDISVRVRGEPKELLGMWPMGYPEWYVAAYPDVVIWAGDEFSTHVSRNLPFTENPLAWEHIREYMLSSKAKGVSHKKFDENLLRDVFGNISSKNELIDDDRLIKHRHLRALIESYRKKTGHTLECST